MTIDTVLLVTTSYDFAASYVMKALDLRGVPYFRFNTDQFPTCVIATYSPPNYLVFDDGSTTVSGDRIKSVWYRRHVAPALPSEIKRGVTDFCERETRAFLEGSLANLSTNRWLSSPQAIAVAERKLHQLKIASEIGFTIPDTLVTNEPSAVTEFADGRRIVAKAVRSGYISSETGNQAIFTSEIGTNDLCDLDGLSLAPVIFQELVEKVSDVRVTLIGEKVFAAEILSQSRESSRVDWRATDDPNLEHRKYDLPQDTSELCRRLLNRFGLGFGAIDLVLNSKGELIFLEINPNGEWVWIEDQLGFPISFHIAAWLDAGVD